MSTDIFAYSESKNADGSYSCLQHHQEKPLGARNYAVFAFIADVRNYDEITPILARRGFPNDASAPVAERYRHSSGRSASHLTIDQLLAVDYSTLVQTGEGEKTLAEYLGPEFLDCLQKLKAEGADRVVFWFDC